MRRSSSGVAGPRSSSTRSRVILHPEREARENYRATETRRRARWERGVRSRTVPAQTLDGVPITLRANIDLPEEITEASAFGAAGVGLYRSEFIYIERSPELPTEEEHLEIYTKMLETMAPHSVVVRTLTRSNGAFKIK